MEQPCLIKAFMLIFLVLRNALVMKSRFQNWYTTRNIALITVPYYNFVFVSEMTVSFLPSNKSLIFACQITDTVFFYVILASFCTYICTLTWKKFVLNQRESLECTTAESKRYPSSNFAYRQLLVFLASAPYKFTP